MVGLSLHLLTYLSCLDMPRVVYAKGERERGEGLVGGKTVKVKRVGDIKRSIPPCILFSYKMASIHAQKSQ